MSDHGTAYGEGGYVGHRLAHPVIGRFRMPKASAAEAPRRLADAGRVLSGSPYVGYSYAYPRQNGLSAF